MIPGDILKRAITLALAVAVFGFAFGVLCDTAGLSLFQASSFSLFVFTGSAQFAAVSVLSAGGTAAAAIISGVLLNLRVVPFGVALAPVLRMPLWRRMLASQLLIDESAVLALAEDDPERSRQAFWAGGIAVFILWNLATIAGAVVAGVAGDSIDNVGLDAAIPAAFLAFLWPRLAERGGQIAAAAGATIAIALVPVAPAGVPIAVASVGAVIAYLAVERS